jgi:hypothetical protein
MKDTNKQKILGMVVFTIGMLGLILIVFSLKIASEV